MPHVLGAFFCAGVSINQRHPSNNEGKMYKKRMLAASLAASVAIIACAEVASAQEEKEDTRGTKQAGDFLVRGRAIAIIPDGGGTTKQLGGDIDVQNSYTMEVDFSYFVTKNIAFELIAATTQHEVKLKNSAAGDVNLGKVRVLPPTLMLQYHFLTDEWFSPYLGAGVNYTVFWDETNGPTAKDVDIDNAWGYAFQAGADFQFPHSNFVFNKIRIHTTECFISTRVFRK